MKLIFYFAIATFLALTGCLPKLNEDLISTRPASDKSVEIAAQAAAICAAQFPSFAMTVAALAANNFYETLSSIVADNGPDFRGRTFSHAHSDVKVSISQQDISNLRNDRQQLVCLIALPMMTPQQSYELALPWVEKFNGQTNEEVGNGLSPLVVQAWRNLDAERKVYIAAYKTWEPLGRQGAAIRLIYIPMN